MRIFFLIILFASQAFAQSYPSRPIKLVVGFAPGGAADFVARVFADPLSRALGAPIVVENKPGAGSSIAAESVAKAAPDGYTVLIASPSSILVNPLLNPNPGFQPLRDLAPVSKVSASPLVVAVNPGVGVSSLRELIDHAKKNPGKLNFATSGNGAAPHLAAVLFQRLAGVEMVHVPYKGGGPAVQSVLAGDTQLSFATPPFVLPLVNAGRVRALAVTSRERTPLVPGVRDLFLVRFLRSRRRAGRGREAPVRCHERRTAERGGEPRARQGRDRDFRLQVAAGLRGFPRRGYTALDAPGEGLRREAGLEEEAR